jgi:hypothetical protein
MGEPPMKRIHASLAIAAAIGSAALFTKPAAAVDNIGNQGQFVIGAERMMGLYFDQFKQSQGGAERTDKATRIGLLGNTDGSVSSSPRLGFDYLVTDGVSVGGSLFYAHTSTSADVNGTNADGPSIDTFFFNPRVGYAYAIDETFAIWPRAGFAYIHQTTSPPSGGGDTTRSGTQLTLEGNLVVSPIEHVALTGGPFLDLGLGGSQSLKSEGGAESSNDAKLTSFGLQFGLAAYF